MVPGASATVPRPAIATGKQMRGKAIGASGKVPNYCREATVPNWLRIACVSAMVLTVMTACTMKNLNVPPDQLMSQFQAGQPMLDCRADCGGAWSINRQKVATLDAAGRWQDLALLVMQIGYMNDLSYYYLGHAAENLGYLPAAQRYYRIAERLSVTQMSCHQGEVEFAATAPLRGLTVNL